MIQGAASLGLVGDIQVAITNGRRRTADEWARMCVGKFFVIEPTASAAGRRIAEPFKADIERALAGCIRTACEADANLETRRSAGEWMPLCIERMGAVIDASPFPIKAQALKFQPNILRIVENYVRMALDEQRTLGNGH